MRALISFSLVLIFAATGCSGDEPTSGSAAVSAEGAKPVKAVERGGTISVGEETWILVPKFCSVYPGNVVNIAGHAQGDPSLEIVIDHGGPDQVVIGSGGREALWYAMKETLKIQVDGKNVKGAATFNKSMYGSGESAEGSFEVNCG